MTEAKDDGKRPGEPWTKPGTDQPEKRPGPLAQDPSREPPTREQRERTSKNQQTIKCATHHSRRHRSGIQEKVDRRELPQKPLGGQLHAARRPKAYLGSLLRFGSPSAGASKRHSAREHGPTGAVNVRITLKTARGSDPEHVSCPKRSAMFLLSGLGCGACAGDFGYPGDGINGVPSDVQPGQKS
jgi:hypothetical protein